MTKKWSFAALVLVYDHIVLQFSGKAHFALRAWLLCPASCQVALMIRWGISRMIHLSSCCNWLHQWTFYRSKAFLGSSLYTLIAHFTPLTLCVRFVVQNGFLLIVPWQSLIIYTETNHFIRFRLQVCQWSLLDWINALNFVEATSIYILWLLLLYCIFEWFVWCSVLNIVTPRGKVRFHLSVDTLRVNWDDFNLLLTGDSVQLCCLVRYNSMVLSIRPKGPLSSNGRSNDGRYGAHSPVITHSHALRWYFFLLSVLRWTSSRECYSMMMDPLGVVVVELPSRFVSVYPNIDDSITMNLYF